MSICFCTCCDRYFDPDAEVGLYGELDNYCESCAEEREFLCALCEDPDCKEPMLTIPHKHGTESAKDDSDEVLTQAVQRFDWTDNIKYGPPDEEGTYLCVFKDGAMETFDYRPGDTDWWTEESQLGDRITHWAFLPPHPNSGAQK